MENLFLFLAAAPNSLLPWFFCFSRSDFPLNPAFPAWLCPCTSRVGKNSLVQTGLEQHSQETVPAFPIPSQNPCDPQEASSFWISHGIHLHECFPPVSLRSSSARGSGRVAIPKLLIPRDVVSASPKTDPCGKRECEGWIPSLWNPL